MRFFITWPRCSFIRVKNSSLSRSTLETKGKMKEKERKRGAARKSKLNACIFNFNSVLRVKKRKIFYIYKIYIYISIDRESKNDRTFVNDRYAIGGYGGKKGIPAAIADISDSVLALKTCFTRVHTTTPRCVLPCVKFDNLAVATRFESIRRK